MQRHMVKHNLSSVLNMELLRKSEKYNQDMKTPKITTNKMIEYVSIWSFKHWIRGILFALTLGLLITILCVSLDDNANHDIFISAVCPHNESVKYDPLGDYSDFIEIRNKTGQTISLEGYCISDSINDLGKYAFPAMVIEPGEKITLWATDTATYSELPDRSDLFTGFKLSDMESVYLTDSSGKVIDSVKLPYLTVDEEYLRSDDLNNWYTYNVAEMRGDVRDISSNITPPTYSHISGFYRDSFNLSIGGCDADADIYYTLDGSDPYRYGQLYTFPIEITDRSDEFNVYASLDFFTINEAYTPTEPVDKCTLVRAVIKKNGVYSKESVASFFVGDKLCDTYQNAKVLSIIAEPDDFFSVDSGIYVNGQVYDNIKMRLTKMEEVNNDPTYIPTNYNKRGKGWERTVRVMLFSESGEYLYGGDEHIRIHGNFTRFDNQKSFKLYDTSCINELFNMNGDDLVLQKRNAQNIRDTVCNRLFRDMRIGEFKSDICQLFINGEYWGCYDIKESLDEAYIADYYCIDRNDVLLTKDFYPVSESEADILQFEELIGFIEHHDLSDNKNYSTLCELVDIDNFIDYYCIELFVENLDYYQNNAVLWKTRSVKDAVYNDGKWRFLIYDMDETCSNAADDSFKTLISDGGKQFFVALIKNKDFENRFRDRFNEFISIYSYDTANRVLSELEDKYRNPVVLSMRRWSDPDYREKDYSEQIMNIRIFFRERKQYIIRYMLDNL